MLVVRGEMVDFGLRQAAACFFGTRAALALVASVVLSACVPTEVSAPAPAPSSRFDFGGQVTRVIDGDTFWVSGQRNRIRVGGLDAPEIGRAGGSAATAQLANLISGRSVQCRLRDVDRYGRIVGQCWLPDGRDIAAAMIASGTAREYCRFSGNYYGTC
ncbi:thermonuclease family protein [Paracoccus sp. 11-3]|uniref:Thermonuclease family protein n=1 Tax=Paracoccus amoyensis TaxID=2760093 RepID=A0A926GHZ4_9RHOB|nr:thermonuclease family protein [Paracoccus amoyensis]MBC9248612.1 thermonuclease family protein [Paracoccus amoyensis]